MQHSDEPSSGFPGDAMIDETTESEDYEEKMLHDHKPGGKVEFGGDVGSSE